MVEDGVGVRLVPRFMLFRQCVVCVYAEVASVVGDLRASVAMMREVVESRLGEGGV